VTFRLTISGLSAQFYGYNNVNNAWGMLYINKKLNNAVCLLGNPAEKHAIAESVEWGLAKLKYSYLSSNLFWAVKGYQ
jgi:hypothetical protein